MSGREWVKQIPDDVLERLWKACMQAKDALGDAASTAAWSFSDDVIADITREIDTWQELAAMLRQEMERREYEPEEVPA